MNTIRYLKQRDNYSCAPVMILNLTKWAGRQASGKDVKEWCHKCKTSSKDGTFIKNYADQLKKIKFLKVRTRNNTSVEDIDRELKKGNAVVIRYARVIDDEIFRHIFLVTKRTESSFYCVNVFKGHHWIPKQQFDYFFLNKKVVGYPKVWYVGQKNYQES